MDRTISRLPPEVLAALQAGRQVEAIKLLRQSTGLGLTEAKQLIDAHARGEPISVPAAAERPVLRTLPPNVAQALQAGNKIEAIRLLREQTGMGLKECKDAVDAAEDANPLSPGQMRDGSGGVMWWVIGAIALAGIYFLMK
jgi:ribosomal protein L7/L12